MVVVEKVYREVYGGSLRGRMLEDDIVGQKMCIVMVTPHPRLFRRRLCCGKRDNAYTMEMDLLLRGCKKIRLGLSSTTMQETTTP